MREDKEALERSNSDRIVALARRGMQISQTTLNDLRLLAYLEELLGDAVPAAELRFERRLAEQLDTAEVQAGEMESMARKASLLHPNGA